MFVFSAVAMATTSNVTKKAIDCGEAGELTVFDSGDITWIDDSNFNYSKGEDYMTNFEQDIQSPQLTRGTGTYNSTYNFYETLVTATTWNATSSPYFRVSLSPTSGINGANIVISLEKKAGIGWSTVDSVSVSSTSSSASNLYGNGAGQYRIRLSQYYNEIPFTGGITIYYSWV